jgi:hypothetical protein
MRLSSLLYNNNKSELDLSVNFSEIYGKSRIFGPSPIQICDYNLYSGVQGKSNAYHNVNKIQNSFTDALILNLIDIVVCVVFALYSSIEIFVIKSH